MEANKLAKCVIGYFVFIIFSLRKTLFLQMFLNEGIYEYAYQIIDHFFSYSVYNEEKM